MSAGFAATRAAVEGLVAAEFDALPIEWENARFVAPRDAPYVALFVRDGAAAHVSTGPAPRRRYAGSVIVQIFVPERSGTEAARRHADALEAIFRDRELAAGEAGRIRFGVPAAEPVGLAHGWWQINLVVPFRRDVA